MIKKFLVIAVLIATVAFAGCSDVPESTVVNTNNMATEDSSLHRTEDSNFNSKILLLQDEMKRYIANDKQLSAKELNSICVSCSDTFKDILSYKDSIKTNENDLLGEEAGFYIKYGKEISIGESMYRLIEYGCKSNADGTIKDLLLQKFDNRTEPQVSDVLRITSTASGIESIENFDFISLNNSYNVFVFSKFNGAEVDVVKLYGYKLESGELSPRHLFNAGMAESWEVDNTSNNGVCILRYKNAAKDYTFSIDNVSAKVVALGSNSEVLSEIKLEFSGSNDITSSDASKSLIEGDFAIIDGKSKIELYTAFKDLKIEKQELKTENNFVGETNSDGFVYKYYMHQYDEFDLYISNANYNIKGKKIDDRYISQITLKKESGFKTPRGINIGSTLEDVFEAYGQTTMKKENGSDIVGYMVNDMGLKFFIDSNQKVSGIIIHIAVKNAK